MARINQENLNILQPKPTIQVGWYTNGPDAVKVDCHCLSCSKRFTINIRGQYKALPERLLVKRIEEIVLNHHRCRAIQDLLGSKLDKYFPDLKRGMQMVQEQEYKISRMGLGPGPLRNPFVVSGRKASKGNA